MKNTKTPTVDKVTFPLRLPPKMYKQIRAKVNEIKENEIFRTEAVLSQVDKNSKKDQHKAGLYLAAPVRLELTTHGLTAIKSK